eukprot:gb/GECG01012227.1/.p1 GENE.gb/GECG01012227.1/~~gb/GECG01012227.1/.p1  ORF type:complete len:839 (+),score=79.34 gb/GECG01012227.1/:1-2517(+)
MSQRRRTDRSPSSTLAPRDIELAKELALVADGRLGEAIEGVRKETISSITIDESSGLKKECEEDKKTLAALFVLLQINSSVERLEVDGIRLDEEWLLKTFAAAVSLNVTLRTLVIKNASLDADALSIFVNSLKRTKNISNLTITGNPLGDDGAYHVCSALRANVGIVNLVLEDNNFTDGGLTYLARALNYSDVEELYLGRNRFAFSKEAFYDKDTDQMLRVSETLGRALEKNSSLRLLDLRENKEVIKSWIAPLFDSLKFNEGLTHLSLQGCKFTNRVFFIIAEFCVATRKATQRIINLEHTGANASALREVVTLRIVPHRTSLKGVTSGEIAPSEENVAQLGFITHLMNRPHGRVFPHSRKERFLLKDGRTVTLFTDEEGFIKSGKLDYTHGDSIRFSMPPLSTVINKEEKFGASYPSAMSRIPLKGTYSMYTSSLKRLIAVGSCLLNIADFALDIAVISQLAMREKWTSFWITLAGLLWAVLYTCYSLWEDKRTLAAALHFVGLSMLPDAYYFVLKGKKPNATVILQSTQPMQGLAAIHRLKLLQTLLEAAPQILFQAFILIHTGPSVTVLLSILLSFVSAVGTTTQSDRQKINSWSNAVEKNWVSTISVSVFFFAAFRAIEILSNIATVSFAMAYFPISPATTVATILESKLVLTIVYWRGNISHFGEVFSSAFASPGTTRITYDWVKNIRRLGVWYYISLQLFYDATILLLLGLLNDVDMDRRVYFAGLGCVLAKYAMAGILWTMHNYCLEEMYADRRHQLTCGLLAQKKYRGPRKSGVFTFKVDNPAKQRLSSSAQPETGRSTPDPSNSRSNSISSSPRKSVIAADVVDEDIV